MIRNCQLYTLIVALLTSSAIAHDAPYNENGCHLDVQCYHCDETLSDANSLKATGKLKSQTKDEMNCKNFKTQLEAQTYFETNYPTKDPSNLDDYKNQEGDYIACESRPRPISKILARAQRENWASKRQSEKKLCSMPYSGGS